MWHERTSHLNHLGPTGGMGRKGGKERQKKGKEGEGFRQRSSTFSLKFMAIEPAVFDGVRGKVHPCGKSFASRPESGSLDKLQEVGVFLLLGLILV